MGWYIIDNVFGYSSDKHDEIIKRSHERSEFYGIDKGIVTSRKILNKEEVSSHIKENVELIRVAAPFIKILYDFLRNSGFFIVLTDREGCILNKIGDVKILAAANELNMVMGAYMDEKSIGTNAMGIAIKEDMPIQVSAKEHFITAYHRWTCSAAPIHDGAGNIIGTLNITGNSDKVHPHTLALVAAAVHSIENQMKGESANKRVLEAYQYLNSIMDSVAFGIFAADKEGNIKNINKIACEMIGHKKEDLLNKSLDVISPNMRNILDEIKAERELYDEELVIAAKGTSEKYNFSAYPIKDDKGSVIGMVVSLKHMQNVYNLVNKYTGMQARYTFDNIIGKSKRIRDIIEYSKDVADSPSTILISGESGTGKEILAQAIHNYSSRRNNGFVAINCGAIPANLIESELFGYADGAFTGARKGGNPGKFELANGGTLFLDEIGEMPLEMQVKLLRALQEGTITRVGGNKYIDVDVRIIAATNRNLLNEVRAGRFREDLYYRLSVIPIILPALRARSEDIPLLINHFLNIKSLKLNKRIPKLDSSLYEKMSSYYWPGNIRELENFVENIVNLNGKTTFPLEDTWDIKQDLVQEKDIKQEINDVYVCNLEELEKRAIESCMGKYDSNVTKCAKTLGISRNTLYLKMKKYNISP